MSRGKLWFVQFFRFNILGIVHVVIFSFILFLSRKMGVNHFLSGAFGYIVIFLVGAFGNIFYVFRSLLRQGHFWGYFIKNGLIYSSSVLFELFSTYILIPYVHNHTQNSDVLVVVLQYVIYGIGGIYVFLMNRYVVFSHRP